MNAREYLEILHVAERLKDTPRHCTTTKRRTESVAEHSWRISLMAFLLRHEFKDLDIDKVVDMCLIHDLGECFTGDIHTFIKTDADREVEDSLPLKIQHGGRDDHHVVNLSGYHLHYMLRRVDCYIQTLSFRACRLL